MSDLEKRLEKIEQHSPTKPVTLVEILELYIRRKGTAERTASVYREKVRRLVTHLGRDPHVLDLTEDVLLTFREDVLSTCAPTTWNTIRRHLCIFLNLAVKERLIEVSPMENIPAAQVTSVPPKNVSMERLRHVCQELKARPDWPWAEPKWYWFIVIAMLFHTGMRRRQMVGLQWRDIDFKTSTVRLDASYNKNRREWRLPIQQQLFSHLMELQRQTLIKVGKIKDQAPVFDVTLFSTRGLAPWTPERSAEHIARFFQKLRTETGIDISAHRLRHTAGTELMRETNNPKLVQMILGHSNLSTTMIYNHPDIDDVRNLLNRVRSGKF